MPLSGGGGNHGGEKNAKDPTGHRERDREHQVMQKDETSFSVRRQELLTKLEVRSRECPGLYPFRVAEDFLRVAMDHGGPDDEGICGVLEGMWRRPDEAVQLNAQSLIRRGEGLDKDVRERPQKMI